MNMNTDDKFRKQGRKCNMRDYFVMQFILIIAEAI